MRLYEYEAKKLLQKLKISIPKHALVHSIDDLKVVASQIGFPAVLKSQVLTGGRMKAGGVLFAQNIEEADVAARTIFNLKIKGVQPEAILFEARAPVAKEYYVGITYDSDAKLPVALLSDQGGIEIEEIAERNPERIARTHFSPLFPFSDYKMKELASFLEISGSELNSLSLILSSLAQAFLAYDLILAEINPLAKLKDGSFVALDARIEIEDEAIYRQQLLIEELGIKKEERQTRGSTPFEAKAVEIDMRDHRGVAGRVVEFDGSLGLIIGGGGACLTIFDAVRKYDGKPANYCEIGGNPSVSKVCELTKLILSKPGVEKIAVIMNVVSNTRVDLVARGVIKGVVEAGYSPAEKIAVFRIPGAWEEEGFRLLRKYSVECLDRTVTIDQAAQRAVTKIS